jgi:hypothetical protein
MTLTTESNTPPEGYARLEGSERHPGRGTSLLGPVEDAEVFSVTIVLRRRVDGPPLPSFDDFVATPPPRRKGLSREEFAAKYGAHPDDLQQIVAFAESSGLEVKKTSLGRRIVVVSGNVAQFGRAFGVAFGRYQQPPERPRRNRPPRPGHIYRGRDGFVHVPEALAPLIVGVFGLDNRRISQPSNTGDPPLTGSLSVPQVTTLYDFPSPGAAIADQTVGIVSMYNGYLGYLQNDVDQTFMTLGLTTPPPQVIPIAVMGNGNQALSTVTTSTGVIGDTSLDIASTSGIVMDTEGFLGIGDTLYFLEVTSVMGDTVNFGVWNGSSFSGGLPVKVPTGTRIDFNLDDETCQDIFMSILAAPGVNVAVYFSENSQNGWIQWITRALEPEPGDFPPGVPPPTVLSSSFPLCNGDDPFGLMQYGITDAMLTALTQQFFDATIIQSGPAAAAGLTFCIASGDMGSNSRLGAIDNPQMEDGHAHVQYPASDPWVLGVGGTTIGRYQPSGSSTLEWVEYVWNDWESTPGSGPSNPWGTGGGGISDYFGVPSYQSGAGVPDSINPAPFNTTGRGVPDVAANASLNSGYSGFYFGGVQNGMYGNGTSAAAPLWAALIAVLNSNAGFNIGFANPTLYANPTAFNPINPLWPDPAFAQLANCPPNNANNGIPGYPAQAGWDACTGLGSPNGMALLNALKELESVYILGGYQSPDVIITDLTSTTPVPIGGMPGGPWDTLLEPSTNYGFSANVHNDSAVAVENVVVSFWAIPGGLAINGFMVGTPQTVSIPAHSTVTVKASADYVSAPAGEHQCAVVSIYSRSTGCSVEATDATDIPDPGYSTTHECSAWRNTDSMTGSGGGQFKFGVGFGKIPTHIDPIIISYQPLHVPLDWRQSAFVTGLQDLLRALGTQGNLPLYLLPALRRAFGTPDLQARLTARGGAIDRRGEGDWVLRPTSKSADTVIEFAGIVPMDAQPGDVILVNISARYPAMEGRGSRTVGFLEFVHIKER